MPTLIVRGGPTKGKKILFNSTILVGRGTMVDVVLDHPTISRRHALLSLVEERCFLLDLKSENGTYINNERITEPRRLHNGDVIIFGAMECEFSQDEILRSTEAPVLHVDEKLDAGDVILTMDVAQGGTDHFDESDGAEMIAVAKRRIRFMNDLAEVFGQLLDQEALLNFLLKEVLELLPQSERAFVVLKQGKELVPSVAMTQSGEVSDIAASQTLLNDVLGSRRAVLVADVMGHKKYGNSDSIAARGIRSALAIPLLFHEEVFGVIQVDSTDSTRPYSKADMTLVLGIASQIAIFLAYGELHEKLVDKELLERDVMLAREIQQHFLPDSPPRIEGYKFSVDYSPALAVGGDFYDFLDLQDGRIGIVVGDVSGKGVSAALYVAKLSNDVRYHSVGLNEPAEILSCLNRALALGSKSGMFVSLAMLVLDPASGGLTISSAGHPLPLLRRKDGSIISLGRSGDMPLGVSEDTIFQQFGYQLAEGELVTIYTDGISEAEDRYREQFGLERLKTTLQGIREADDPVQAVLVSLKAFVGNLPQSDDITLLCFGRN